MRSKERAAIESITPQWPWRDYPYKFGRWVYRERITVFSVLTESAGKLEWHRDMRTFLLVDPNTGEGMTEFLLPRTWLRSYRGLERYSGHVQFAGDPNSIGVIRSNTASGPARLVHAKGIKRATALSAAMDLHPDQPTPATLFADPAASKKPLRYADMHGPDHKGSMGRCSPKSVRRPWICDLPY